MIGGINALSNSFDEPIDRMKLFFNWEYPITDSVVVKQPSVQQIIDYPGGESEFMYLVNILTGNTTLFRVQLWDQKVDWNKISDWQMFTAFVKSLSNDHTRIFLGDLDFTKMELYPDEDSVDVQENEDDEEYAPSYILYDSENDIVFNELTYLRVRNYLRYMFNIFPTVEVGIKKKRIKEEIIEYDRKVIEKRKKENPSSSFLFPIISTLLVYDGFKYKKEELREVGIVELMDAAQRVQLIENSRAVMGGLYSGFVDGSKIKPETYDFMKDLANVKRVTDAKEIAINSVTSKGETK